MRIYPFLGQFPRSFVFAVAQEFDDAAFVGCKTRNDINCQQLSTLFVSPGRLVSDQSVTALLLLVFIQPDRCVVCAGI